MKKPLHMVMLALLAIVGTTCTASAQLINVTYAGQGSGVIPWKAIAADSILKVRQPGIEVISFEMQHLRPFWDAIEYKSFDKRITPQMRKEFKYLHTDDLLLFKNIKAKNEKGDTLWADPINFKIK